MGKKRLSINLVLIALVILPIFLVACQKTPKKDSFSEPSDSKSYRLDGIKYSEQGNNEKALEMFLKSVEAYPKNFLSLNGIASSYRELKNYKEAIKYYKKSLELEPNFYDTYRMLGLTYYLNRDFSAAIDTFKKAIEIDPNNPLAYNGIGSSYRELGDFKTASEYYNKSLSLDPDNEETSHVIGVLRYYLGDYVGAKRYLNFIPNRENWNQNFYLLLSHMQTSDIDPIIQITDKLKEATPNDKNVYSFAGAAYILKNQPKLAIENYKKSVELTEDADKSRLHYNSMGLSMAYLLDKNYGQAFNSINDALGYDISGDAFLTLAVYYDLTGDNKNYEYYIQKTKTLGVSVTTFEILGKVYLHQNSYEKAEKIYLLGLEYYPGNEMLKRGLLKSSLRKNE
jgi:tetratricopeptide (TPR) repeat protein